MESNNAGDASATAVNIRPKNIYGLRTDVVGNIHFNLYQEVIYPVEGVLAFHDYVSNKQRFLRLAPLQWLVLCSVNWIYVFYTDCRRVYIPSI